MIEFWTGALALSIFLYVLLDGLDLGVGILYGFADDNDKRLMLLSISPVWDGNETWLVIAAAVLFGAFPSVYALLLSAFYMPLILLLCGLIFRGVAFEFRERSERLTFVWDAGFAIGSALVAFVQGCAVGALVLGLPNVDARFTGSAFFWARPFPVICGVGLCLGYAMLGAGWLIKKTEGAVRELAYRQARWLLVAVLVFLIAAFVFAVSLDLRVMSRWIERPFLIVFPLLGALGVALMLSGIARQKDGLPLLAGILLFIAAYGTLAASFLPYMVPFSITYLDAAAPPNSLSFLFWFAGIIVLPLTIIYTVISFSVFRGKVKSEDHY